MGLDGYGIKRCVVSFPLRFSFLLLSFHTHGVLFVWRRGQKYVYHLCFFTRYLFSMVGPLFCDRWKQILIWL